MRFGHLLKNCTIKSSFFDVICSFFRLRVSRMTKAKSTLSNSGKCTWYRFKLTFSLTFLFATILAIFSFFLFFVYKKVQFGMQNFNPRCLNKLLIVDFYRGVCAVGFLEFTREVG